MKKQKKNTVFEDNYPWNCYIRGMCRWL